MRSSLYTLTAVLVALVLSSSARAQAPATPGPEHAVLKKMEGTWDCTIKAGDQQSKGTAVIKMILGGLWLESDFKGEFGGAQFSGRGLDGYDQHKKKYVTVWTDSMSSSLMLLDGTYDEASKTLTLSGTGTGPDGSSIKFKNTTTMVDNDHQVFKMYMVGADGSENLMMTIDYARKK